MPQIHAPPDAPPQVEPVRAALADGRVLEEIRSAARRLTDSARKHLPWAIRMQESEEVASAAIAKALEKASEFDPALGRSVTAWIVGFVKNFAFDKSGKRGKHGGDSPADKTDPSPSAQDGLILESDKALVRAALAKLDPSERDLARRRYFDGEYPKAIAAETGQNAGAVRTSLHRIRKKLFDLLSPSFEGGRS